MKKILNGKKYDTETATLIGSYDNGCLTNDFGYCEENLYHKRTGEYFLHGRGGANSKYRTYSGMNSWGGGQEIRPLTQDEAKSWAEDHLNVDEYEKEFGVVEE